MARNTRTYSDLDFSFIANPSTKDVAVRYDDNAVKQSIRTLVMTNHYERPFHPEIGSQINDMLFEPYSPLTKAMMERAITNTIVNHEPRVVLREVSVNPTPDNNSVYVQIVFTIVNTSQPISVNLLMQRTR